MPRHRRDDDLFVPIAQLVGLIFLLGIASPHFRTLTSAIGMLGACIVGAVSILAVGFLIYLAVKRSKGEAKPERNINWTELGVNLKSSPPISTAQLLEKIRAIDWFQFEKLIEIVYHKKGFEVQRRGGANPDGGIDLIIQKDAQKTAIQCKQWKTWNVGVRPVREFVGALKVARIDHGIFITLRGYTGDAKRLADEQAIEIVNETSLVKLLREVDARLDPQVLALLNDHRKFCPKCEREMEQKMARRGRKAGQFFWACPAFPRCNGRFSIS